MWGKKLKLYKSSKGFIVESSTRQNIIFVNNRRKRDNLLKLLNSGSGFNGFTPQFFTLEVVPEKRENAS